MAISGLAALLLAGLIILVGPYLAFGLALYWTLKAQRRRCPDATIYI